MNFNASISTVTSTQFSSIGRIDLNDYYTSDPRRQIIRCQICKLNILKIDVFEHTISKRHKYNKLYVAISQNRCCNLDVDFVVLDIDRLQCRYCNSSLIIDSDRDDLIISHIQDCRHVQNKQACLNRFSFSSKGVSTVEQKLLQPLDSFITHDMKARKPVKKKAEKIQMKENLLETTGLMFEEQIVLSNVDETIDQQYLLFSRDFKRQRGEEVPKFIINGEEATCRCTICMIEMPKTTYNVGGHIDGKKHQKKMPKESTRYIEQRTEIVDMKKNSPAESMLSKYCEIEGAVKDIRKTNNMVENDVSENSLFSKDFKRKRGEEVPKFIILGEGATCRCTICMIEIPKTTYNVGGHIDGKKHKKNCASTSTVRSTKIQKTSKNIDEHMNDEYESLIIIDDIVERIKAQTQKLKLPASNKFLPSTSFSNVKNGVYICTTCDVSVSNNKRCIEQHNNGQKHFHKILQTFPLF